jgi:hypothetical protein
MTDAGCGLPPVHDQADAGARWARSVATRRSASRHSKCFQRLGDHDRGFLGRISVNEASPKV